MNTQLLTTPSYNFLSLLSSHAFARFFAQPSSTTFLYRPFFESGMKQRFDLPQLVFFRLLGRHFWAPGYVVTAYFPLIVKHPPTQRPHNFWNTVFPLLSGCTREKKKTCRLLASGNFASPLSAHVQQTMRTRNAYQLESSQSGTELNADTIEERGSWKLVSLWYR